ncbi:diguanylate cyclase (GGDEF) domain-containing protein [Tindallia magadiensis]|uniref:Diguanylate cyclase (GGDEF) domain-containing protein n=2 Tax=Tindallia magadiensis TaxID=69895 RepID=A0A1I3DYW2_9FIRM|nr:diguanylate cyclase (GGDEF) domain-containing protein [Tindallia magadiensis]
MEKVTHMKSIRVQMLVYLMIGAGILFTGMLLFINNKLSDLPEVITEQYQEVTEARANELSHELRGYMKMLQMVSQSPELKKMDITTVKEYLPDLVLPEIMRNMTVIWPDATGWSSVDQWVDVRDQEQYLNIIEKGEVQWISQPFKSPYIEEDWVIIISHSIKNERQQNIGIVNMVVPVGFMNRIVEDVRLGRDTQAWIISEEGNIVSFSPDARYEAVVGQPLDAYKDLSVNSLFQQPSGYVEYTSYDDEEMLMFFHEILHSPNWYFAIAVPAIEIYGEVNSIANAVLAILLFGSFLIIVFAFFYAHSLSRPILALQKVFREAASGNLNIRADETTPNELGEAGKNFNQMIYKIRALTYYDPITNLTNYNGFMLEVPHIIEQMKKEDKLPCIAIISIDGFKRINSISGYESGDQVLKHLARRLESMTDRDEMVARHFGDEFILLISANSVKDIEKRVHLFWKHCSTILHLRDNEFVLKTSIGAAFCEQGISTAEEIFNRATLAKLSIKQQGGNGFQFYNKALEEQIMEEQTIENHLHHAIERKEFRLVYQPIVNGERGTVEAYEALLRWNHPAHVNLGVQQMIQIAEQNGQILEIGSWVLEEACRQNQKWRKSLQKPDLVICVNVSALQFEQRTFTQTIRETLRKTGLPGHCLELEITERIAMTGMEEKLEKMKELKEMGVRMAIDDFGTGYSSLSYFTRYPIDTLKIDKSFINKMGEDQGAETIVNTIINMAHSMEMKAVAEGVETREQMDYLLSKKCDFLQGYYLSKPMEAKVVDGTSQIND